jgi:hypothetical protein
VGQFARRDVRQARCENIVPATAQNGAQAGAGNEEGDKKEEIAGINASSDQALENLS